MYGIVDCDNAYVSYKRYYFTQIIHKDMKRLFILMIVILALGATANSQTIRNANNSMLATINTNGEVRNSNNSLIASITPQDAKGVLMIYHFNYIK